MACPSLNYRGGAFYNLPSGISKATKTSETLLHSDIERFAKQSRMAPDGEIGDEA